MRYLLITALLIPSLVVAEDAIPEPRYGYSYTKEDVQSLFKGCIDGSGDAPFTKDSKNNYCFCITWHTANEVSKYRFSEMEKDEVRSLLLYLNKNFCGGNLKPINPPKPEPKAGDRDTL